LFAPRGAVHSMKGIALLSTILSAGLAASVLIPQCGGAQSISSKHSITLNFDYDFKKGHACDSPTAKNCVKQFNVYDISGNKLYFLFSIPAPSGASGAVKGIRATSPELNFENGTHWLGVAAQMAEGAESDPRVCRIAVEIK
jgi:hypothetical protein